ncbi:hypothetical protein [Herbidospora galbida]|uniref:hypothetical protein n=1 Tax=Herbidospora galbida TaxID=2575442 RepID=UPI001BAF5D4C|nr:hypothetical protein [Herbidospora galbida]
MTEGMRRRLTGLRTFGTSRCDGISSPADNPSNICLRRNRPGPYQIQAAINAVHSDAPTDWRQVVRLYDRHIALAPTPVLALHRAVAVAEVDGPSAALGLLDDLDLDGHHLFHAVRADLLRRLGRSEEALGAYEAALARTDNPAEREVLRRRLAQVRPSERRPHQGRSLRS